VNPMNALAHTFSVPLSADRYEALLRVSESIAAHRDSNELFRTIASQLRQVVAFDFLNLVLYEEGTQKLKLRLIETPGYSGDTQPRNIPPEKTVSWWVYKHQQPMVIPLIGEETRFPEFMEFLKGFGMRSICALPLTTVHRSLGTLGIGSTHANAYSDEEVRFLSLVANQLALAIDDALNLQASQHGQQELQHRNERLKLVLDISQSVASTLDLHQLCREISSGIRRALQCDLAMLALPEPDNLHLRVYGLDFPESKGFIHDQMLIPIEAAAPPVIAFRTGKSLVVDFRELAPFCPGGPPVAEGLESGCSLPLISRDHVLGTLNLARLQKNAFSEADIEFLTQVANQIAIAVENAMAYGEIAGLKEKLAQEKLYLEEEIRSEFNFEEIVGESPALGRVLQEVEIVAPSDSTVLILGETGTGKELVARAIHNRSRRKDRTFVKLNCAAIPTGLLESELFGHEKGAFTGAVAQKIGRLELADRGTLFLDEVGDIPLELQPKLLRAIQEREFERLGSSKTKNVDVRLVAATNRDLQKMIADREFRSDLYYRLNVFPLHIPALRERPEDIPVLVRHFVEKFARRMDKRIESIPAATMRKLTRWHWPGNVRELENLIERVVILTRGSVLNLPLSELDQSPAPTTNGAVHNSEEYDQILRVLKETHGRIGGPSGAAARLGIKRTTLISRMNKLGIKPNIDRYSEASTQNAKAA
jgi:formate hydrogenlyase transcriptional activator